MATPADISKGFITISNVFKGDCPVFVLFLFGKNFQSILKFPIAESNFSVALWLDSSNIIRVLLLDYKQNKPSARLCHQNIPWICQFLSNYNVVLGQSKGTITTLLYHILPYPLWTATNNFLNKSKWPLKGQINSCHVFYLQSSNGFLLYLEHNVSLFPMTNTVCPKMTYQSQYCYSE